MANMLASITLPPGAVQGGDTVVGTIHNKDETRFYTWGWGVFTPDGVGLGDGGWPIGPGETAVDLIAYDGDVLRRYGSATLTLTLHEWFEDPGYPPDFSTENYIGTSTASAVIYPSDLEPPTITGVTLGEGTPAVAAIAGLTDYVQGVSTVTWDIVAVGSDGLPPAAYEITIDGTLYRGKAGSSAVITNSGTLTVATKVTEVSGRTQTTSQTIDVLPYSPPKINSYLVERSDSLGAPDYSGTYAHVVASATASSIFEGSELNVINYTVRSRVVGGAWVETATGTSGLTLGLDQIYSGLLVDESYEIRLEVTDKLMTIAATTFVPKGGIVLDLGEGTVGVGKEWEVGALDVGGDIHADGSIGVDGDVEAVGNAIIFGSISAYGNIAAGGETQSTTVRITSTGDASLTSTNHGLQVGPTGGANVIMDGNEIMARDNGATSNLGFNWNGGNIGLGDSTSEVTLPGQLLETGLPEPQGRVSTVSITSVTSTAWANLANIGSINVTVPRACWVTIDLGAWVQGSGGDVRCGVALSGATTLDPHNGQFGDAAWGSVLWSQNTYQQRSATKVVKINAGTTTFRMRAYRVSGTVSVNYAHFTVTPMRFV